MRRRCRRPAQAATIRSGVTIEVVTAAGLLMWGGATLLTDAWLIRRRRPALADRLRPFSGSVADEAEAWLGRR